MGYNFIMAHINLNKKAFFNNLDIIAQLSSSKDKVAIVLKDNAYGHGLLQMAALCKEYGIKKAVVRNETEAVSVKEFFDYILVLADIADVMPANAVYAINSLDAIPKFPSGANVEIKVDSGMHRNGIVASEIEEAFKMCVKHGLYVKGVFTHHRAADEISCEWYIQETEFKRIKEIALHAAKIYGISKLSFHSQNSAALFRAGECMHDMVRVGIAAYGCLERNDLFMHNLEPVLSLYASRLATRVLQKGQKVGYGGMFEADKPIRVSTYDVGYADGLLRLASNRYITPDGYKILGKISMDSILVDSDEDSICIFNNALEYAKSCDTISYEILVGMRTYIKRIII